MKLSLTIICALVGLRLPALAQEYSNAEYHFAISLPADEGWETPQPLIQSTANPSKSVALLLQTTNKIRAKRITIQVLKVDNDISMANPQIREGFKSGLIGQSKETCRVTSEESSNLAGVPCYKLSLQVATEQSPVNMRVVALDANGYQFNLFAFSTDTTVVPDSSLETILSSFRFTEPPKLPESGNTDFEKGRAVGQIVFWVSVVGVTGFLILRRNRSRKAA